KNREFFYKRKTWSCGEIIAKIAGNWLRMIRRNARSALYKSHSSFFKYIKILVSEQRNTACEIALKYHKI
ncbi:hypothetical protein, partial [Holdemanella biformis]|uniref:hypothetical protein n=1 Tax=Holdemanella biformis TaxID=1735 RepID=UPI0022E0DEAB